MQLTADAILNLNLSIPQIVELVQGLWDKVAERHLELELTAAQKTELDYRLKEYHKNPHNKVSWSDGKKKILGRHYKNA